MGMACRFNVKWVSLVIVAMYALIIERASAEENVVGRGDESVGAAVFGNRPKVMASIKPVALLVQAIAGEDFEVDTLLSTQRNPHAQTMTLAERHKLEQASLIVWLGPSFERFLVKPMLANQAASIALGALPRLHWPNEHETDLHIWLNPDNIAEAYRSIAAELIGLNPIVAIEVNQRLEQALSRLSKTRQHIAQELKPLSNSSFGVSHDGFGHFVTAFSLKQKAAVSKLPEQQIAIRHMFELRRELDGARCLIVEALTPSSKKLAASLGLPAIVVDPLGKSASINSIDTLLLSVSGGFKHCLSL